jgi:Rrf2 family protein
MRISAKCRYGVAALIRIAEAPPETLTGILKLSEDLDISKIYLEQVFGKLRHAGIVTAVRGAAGGYRLAMSAGEISLADIVYALEDSFAENSYATVGERSPEIDEVIAERFSELDVKVRKALSEISLESLAKSASEKRNGQEYMFYI